MRVRKSVKRQAEENVDIQYKKDGKIETLKKGSHVDPAHKHLEDNTVGMSIGTTVNMDNYESLRVDVWATVGLDGKSVEQRYEELRGILDKQLRDTVASYTSD